MNNASFEFYYGAMGCGKTRKLQGDYYSKIEDGFYTIVMKPAIDKKCESNTLARDGSIIKANFLISSTDNIYTIIVNYLLENNLDFILVDEAQFLEKHHVEELSEIVDLLGINVICYGLRTDFKGELFQGSKRLFEMVDDAIQLKRQCSCGNNKVYNMRLIGDNPVFDGEQIAIDGLDATYKSICRKEYKNAKKKNLILSRKKKEN